MRSKSETHICYTYYYTQIYPIGFLVSRFNAREVGHFAGKQMIETLLSPRPFERKAIPTSGSRVRLPPPAPPSSLPTFALPRTVCATLPGSSTLLHSSVPQLVASLENQPLVTGEPGMEKLCMLKVRYFYGFIILRIWYFKGICV